jgi:thiol-disulfide isomerase/thioredoxin
MTDQNFYENNKPILADLITKRDELGLKNIKIEFKWREDYTISGEKTKEGIILLSGCESTSHQESFENFRSYVESLANEKILDEMECEEGLGSQFPDVESCIDLNTNETKTWSHKKGEVCLVDVWATWCGPCQAPMSHNQEMLEKNPDWNGKASIVGLSTDEKMEDIKKRVEEKKWNKIQHYQLVGGWGHSLMKKYGISGIPCVFLLDKDGIVRYKGHPSSIDLESSINKLINGKSITEDSQDEGKSQNLVSFEEKSALAKNLEEFSTSYPYVPNRHYVYLVLNKNVTKDNIDDLNFEGSISVTAYDQGDSDNKLSDLQHHFKNMISTCPKFKLTSNLYFKKKFTPRVGTECSKCNSELSNEVPRYFCIPCQVEGKDKYTFCTNCIKEDEDFEGNPSHEHVLYYLPPGLADNDGIVSGLTNLREKSKQVPAHPEKYVGGYGCDNCGKSVKLINWSCGVCHQHVNGSFDLCNDCFKLTLDSSKESELKAHVEHDYKKHPMIRIPYNMRAVGEDFKKLD